MASKEPDVTRREMIILGTAAVAVAAAGCAEGDSDDETEPGTQADGTDPSNSTETDDSEGTDEADSSDSDTAQDDQTEQTTEDEESEEADEDSTEDDESEETEEEYITVDETYVAPVNNSSGAYNVYTPRRTVTTIDGFGITLEVPTIQRSVGPGDDGLDVRLDGNRLATADIEVLQEGSTSPITINILMKDLTNPGQHTATVELDDTIIDLPDGQTTATEQIDFSVEQPRAEPVTETYPVKETVEVVLETNIAPGQIIPTQMQSQEGERPVFFFTKNPEVESDGTASATYNFAAIEERSGESAAGTEGTFTGRPATDAVSLFEKEIVLGE